MWDQSAQNRKAVQETGSTPVRALDREERTVLDPLAPLLGHGVGRAALEFVDVLLHGLRQSPVLEQGQLAPGHVELAGDGVRRVEDGELLRSEDLEPVVDQLPLHPRARVLSVTPANPVAGGGGRESKEGRAWGQSATDQKVEDKP